MNTLFLLAAVCAGNVVFEDTAPSCPDWTYHDDGNRLTQGGDRE